MARNNFFEALNPRLNADMARFRELQEELSKGPSFLDQFATAATTRRTADGQIVSSYNQVYAAEQQEKLGEARQLAANLQQRQASGQSPRAMEPTKTEQAVGKLGKALGYGALLVATPIVAPAIALPIRLLKGTVGIPTPNDYMADGLKKSLVLYEQIASLQARSKDAAFQQQTAAPFMPMLIQEHNFLAASVNPDPEKLADLSLRPLETQLTRYFSRSAAQARITQESVLDLSNQTNAVVREQNLQMAAAVLTEQLVSGKVLHTIDSMEGALKQTITPKKGKRRGVQIEGQLLLNISPRSLIVHGILSGNLSEIPRAIASKFIRNEAGQTGITVAITQEAYSNPNFSIMEGGFATEENILPINAQREWDESTFWSLLSNTAPGRLVQRMIGIDPTKQSLEVGYIRMINPDRQGDDLKIPMAVVLDGRSSKGGAKVILDALASTQQITQVVGSLEGRKPLPRPVVEQQAMEAARQVIFEQGARPNKVILESITIAQRLQQQDAIRRQQLEPVRQYGRELRLRQERAARGEEITQITNQLQTETDRAKREFLRATKATHQARISELDDLLARGGNPTDSQ